MGIDCAAAHPGVKIGPVKSSALYLGLLSRPVGLRTGEPYCPATHGRISVPDIAPTRMPSLYDDLDILDRLKQPRYPGSRKLSQTYLRQRGQAEGAGRLAPLPSFFSRETRLHESRGYVGHQLLLATMSLPGDCLLLLLGFSEAKHETSTIRMENWNDDWWTYNWTKYAQVLTENCSADFRAVNLSPLDERSRDPSSREPDQQRSRRRST